MMKVVDCKRSVTPYVTLYAEWVKFGFPAMPKNTTPTTSWRFKTDHLHRPLPSYASSCNIHEAKPSENVDLHNHSMGSHWKSIWWSIQAHSQFVRRMELIPIPYWTTKLMTTRHSREHVNQWRIQEFSTLGQTPSELVSGVGHCWAKVKVSRPHFFPKLVTTFPSELFSFISIAGGFDHSPEFL